MKILFATDGSEHSAAAATMLRRLPFHPQTELDLLTVVEWPEPSLQATRPIFGSQVQKAYETIAGSLHEQAAQNLQQQSDLLARSGFRVRTHLLDGHAAVTILEAVERLNIDLLVVGSRGLGRLEGLLLGSVTDQLVPHVKCSVLVVRHRPEKEKAGDSEQLLSVLLAFDDSPGSWRAVDMLESLHPERNLALTVLGIVPSVPAALDAYGTDLLVRARAADKESLQDSAARAAHRLQGLAAGLTVEIRDGDPRHQILTIAQEGNLDIVVVGAQGKGRIASFILGSVSHHVVRHAACTVWLVK